MQEANRMKRLPAYLFTVVDQLKEEVRAKGIEVIDLGMGNPDLPASDEVVEELCRQAKDPENHRYSRPSGVVEKKLKEAIAQWYYQRFKVQLDPGTEVLPLIGAKEGVAHLSLAFLNHDDIAIVPNPTYPVHFDGVIMAGGILYSLPLTAENQFIPDFKSVNPEVTKRAKLLFVSYPHNPTSQVVDRKFYEDLIDWARSKELILASDLAYSDIVFDGYQAPSILQVPGSKQGGAIEFHTLSKSYNMAGWRIGFAAGNKEILASLAKTKSYIDFGIFRPVQWAAIKALTGSQDCVRRNVEIYRKRRDLFVDGLNAIGWKAPRPKATFYVWAKIPVQYNTLTALEFITRMVKETGVAASPGTGFGEYGEGYVRFALVAPEEKLKAAVERIQRFLNVGD